VQHFRKARLQPRAFSGSKNNDGKVFGGHGVNSFWGSRRGLAKW
jgi:hypothetical protein